MSKIFNESSSQVNLTIKSLMRVYGSIRGSISGALPNISASCSTVAAHKHLEFSSKVDGASSDNKSTQQLRNNMQVNSLWYSGYAAYVLARTNSAADVGLSSAAGSHSHDITLTKSDLYKDTNLVQPTSLGLKVKTRVY